MNLVGLFQKLESSKQKDVFDALLIDSKVEHRLAKTYEGFPLVMIYTKKSFENKQRFSLKNLKIQQDIECSINDNGKIRIDFFTLISFTNSSIDLQTYFLKISESLLNSLPSQPTEKQVTEVISKFLEIFKALSEPAHKSALGLWGELFIIAESKQIKTLLTAWHNDPYEKYDFGADDWRMEVKTSVQDQRIHSFSLEQLNPPQGVEVTIASILTKQTISGKSYQDLCEIIKTKVNDLKLIEKMNLIVAKTLGDTVIEAKNLKFDTAIARQTLRFFPAENIPKITSNQVPSQVFNVKFWVNLMS